MAKQYQQQGDRASFQSFTPGQTGVMTNDTNDDNGMTTGILIHDVDRADDRTTEATQPLLLNWLCY